MCAFFSGQGGNCAYGACIRAIPVFPPLHGVSASISSVYVDGAILKRSFTEELAANRIIRPLRYAEHEWSCKSEED